MQYGKILPARFLSRPNRFVARVEAEGEELVCHVKNTEAPEIINTAYLMTLSDISWYGAKCTRSHRLAGGESKSVPQDQI